MIKQFLFVLALLFSVGSASLYAAPQVIPQAQAAHFCQLLIAEVQTGHWSTVDAYVERMIQYQCQFGGSNLSPRPSSAAIIGIFFLFFASISLPFLKRAYTELTY